MIVEQQHREKLFYSILKIDFSEPIFAAMVALRHRIEAWFECENISPLITGEFDDSAMMKAFGEAGIGIFPAPTVIENEICRMYHSDVVGRTKDITEQFYAISPERRLRHPMVVHITESARTDVFPSE